MKWDELAVSWREVLDGICDGVAIVDTQGVQRYVNRALCAMLGFSEQELLGKTPPFDYWPPEELNNIRPAFARALAGDASGFDLVLNRKNGERFPALIHPGRITHKGETVAYIATVADISERRRLEKALAVSEQRWRSIAENPFDFVVVIDRDYRYTFVNHTAPGIRAEDLIGKATPFDFLEPDQCVIARQTYDKVFDTAQAESYEVHVAALGRTYTTIVGPIIEEREGGRYVAALSLLTRDVTEQRIAEQALRQSQRMEALGRLAGGIAHDFNNLLVPILGYARLLQADTAIEPTTRAQVTDIVTAAQRARKLISRILLFGRDGSREREPVLLQELTREIARFLAASLPDKVTMETRLDDTCPAVLGIPGDLHQLISNLCSNAVAALEDTGGHLSLVIEPAQLGDSAAARIIVADTGHGIPPELQSRVFEPFFTTRPVGKGTGLGLSIVHAIVTRHRGQIQLDSQPGKGTRFEIVLPAAEAALATSRAAELKPPDVATPCLRIVCVDDDEMVLRWIQCVLEGAGHNVTAFDNVTLALEYCRAHPAEIDCVLSDELMPAMRGSEFAARLAKTNPQLPVLLISGTATADGTGLPTRPPNVRRCLSKPIDPEALCAAIAQASNVASPHSTVQYPVNKG